MVAYSMIMIGPPFAESNSKLFLLLTCQEKNKCITPSSSRVGLSKINNPNLFVKVIVTTKPFRALLLFTLEWELYSKWVAVPYC